MKNFLKFLAPVVAIVTFWVLLTLGQGESPTATPEPRLVVQIDAPAEVHAGETFTVTVRIENYASSTAAIHGDVFIRGSGWRGHNPIQTDDRIGLEWEECNTPLGREGCRVWFKGQILLGQTTLVTIPVITDHAGDLTVEVVLVFDSEDFYTAVADKKFVSIR